ncbi:MAG: glycerophosphodiester phosphodiesterase family protein [Acidobacteriota bacterium]
MHHSLVIAHRGASGLAPENTLAAFRLAIELGAEGIELDVQMSSDGHPVVIHDLHVNRTTDDTGSVSSFTANELAHLDASRWFQRRLKRRPRTCALVNSIVGDGFAREGVPTLEAALRVMAPANLKRIYIELKSRPANRQPLIEATLALARRFEIERAVTLLSFDHEAIRLAKEIAPHIRAAATFPVTGRALVTARSIIASAKRGGADEAALHFGIASRRAIAALHENGLKVSVWTVNRKMMMKRLVSFGADAIMTNYPNRLIEVLRAPR